MRQDIRNKTVKQFSTILTRYRFRGKELLADALQNFNQLIETLVGEVVAFNTPTATSSERGAKIQLLIEIVEKQQEEPTLNSLAKKICLLFMLLRRMVQEDMMDALLQEIFRKIINGMLKQDLPRLVKTKQKKASSISKLYGFIRELSGSKQKNVDHGRTNLQGEADRGALREIVTHIFQPFCCYLLRMLQSQQAYVGILRKHSIKSQRQVLWTMINSAKALGHIIDQLHRFGRYFINDLMGILLYLTFIASKDISLYFDVLVAEAETQAKVWLSEIQKQTQDINSGRKQGRTIYRCAQFSEVKDLIDQVAAIREKIHYIFGNKYLKGYRYHFAKPNSYDVRIDKAAQAFQPLLQYHRLSTKYSKSRSNSKINTKQPTCIPEISSMQQLNQQEANSQEFNVHQEELQYKLAGTMPTKPRMNNWLNRAQRNRRLRGPAIMADKQDVISTNERPSQQIH